MEILGHANIHTTLQIYTQVIGDTTAQAVAQLDALLDVRDAS
jgi:site-specific recombinase XerD